MHDIKSVCEITLRRICRSKIHLKEICSHLNAISNKLLVLNSITVILFVQLVQNQNKI